MYRYRKCRCDVCKAAAKIERAKYRKLTDSVDIRLDPTVLIDRIMWAGRIDEVRQRTMDEWLVQGIDIYWADWWCIKLGYHPAEIFGMAFYQGCFEGEDAA